MEAETIDLRAGHEDLTEKTYRTLKRLVVTRAIPAGAKVTAEGLSQRFGVSRTTVKGAIDQLASEGLLEVRPQVGTFVRGLTAKDVRDVWDVRVMLETQAVRWGVAAATDEQREELERLLEELEPLVSEREYREETYERSVALNRRLHEVVVETGGNEFLTSVYRQLSGYFHIADYRSRRGLRRADLGLQEHRAIVRAYEKGDGELAAETVRRHIERSRDVLLKAMETAGEAL